MAQTEPKIDRVRYEYFGGIISCAAPPFLAWVDRDFMRSIGCEHSPLWDVPADPGYLSAPTEVHCAVTSQCLQACEGCYTDSKRMAGQELSIKELKAQFKELRELGVFHVALGGGEAFLRQDLHEIVSYCREIGLVPNLTTSGQSIGDREVAICKIMGQVNVSIDGIGDAYGCNGRHGSFEAADAALRRLKKAAVNVGINCVVSKNNFSHLAQVVGYAVDLGLNEVEFLKFKPSGRGRECYEKNRLPQEMLRGFYRSLAAVKRSDSCELKIDCSFLPALLYHRPPREDLEKCAVTGCDGGNILLSVKSNGVFSGCSFVDNADAEQTGGIKERWHASAHLQRFRDLVASAREPCKSCDYLTICRCGCRGTALFYTGDFFTPDPECPFVFDYNQGRRVPNFKNGGG